MENHHGKIKLLTGSSHPELAGKVAEKLGLELVKANLGIFPNGEIRAQVIENVRGCDVFFLASLHAGGPISFIEETELIIDCVKDTAARITGIFTWAGYSKQDRRTRPRESDSFKIIAKRLSRCGLTRALLFDLHNSATAGFFEIPIDQVYLMKLLIEELTGRGLENVVIGSPDIGSAKRAEAVARVAKITDTCFVWKIHHPATKELDLSKSKVIGDVKGKNVWLFDDLIQSGETLALAARLLKLAGARSVIAAAVHPDFIPATYGKPSTVQNIAGSELDEVIVVDTIPRRHQENWTEKIKVLDPSKFIADCIVRLHHDESLSSMFLQY